MISGLYHLLEDEIDEFARQSVMRQWSFSQFANCSQQTKFAIVAHPMTLSIN
jgi:hypothetical protein